LEEVEEPKKCEEDLGGEWCDVGYSCDGEDITSQAYDDLSHPVQACCKPPGNCKEITADKPCIKAGGECIWGSANCAY